MIHAATWSGAVVRGFLNTILGYAVLFAVGVAVMAIAQSLDPQPTDLNPIAATSYYFVWLAFGSPFVLAVLVVVDIMVSAWPHRLPVIALSLVPSVIWWLSHADDPDRVGETAGLAVAGVLWRWWPCCHLGRRLSMSWATSPSSERSSLRGS